MSRILRPDDPLAAAVAEAIRGGDIEELKRLLRGNQGLASATIRSENGGDPVSRTLLHVATDWPGHFPNVAATIDALVDAGADVNAAMPLGRRRRCTGRRAATTSRRSTRWSTLARTSMRRGQ
jgi:hypothetical protein